MNNIEFFVNLNKSINLYSEEITITSNKIEENLFNSKEVPIEYLTRFINEIGEKFGEGININKLQQFSFQAADGIAYNEHKFMAVFSGGKTDVNLYKINVKNPHDDYCVNYFMDSKKMVAKFYDLDVDKYNQPELPKNSKIIYHWGQGVSENAEKNDVYFLHKDVELVSNFVKLPMPAVKEIKNFVNNKTFEKVFGLTYDYKSLKPLKLKLYYYPKDPKMKNTVFDEIIT
jgi:hypothetical protein